MLDETDVAAGSFAALVVLASLLLVLAVRWPRPRSVALRSAAAAAAGVLVWGIASLAVGPTGGAVVAIVYLPASLAGFIVDRQLLRAREAERRAHDGLLGFVVAPFAVALGICSWIFIGGVPSHAATVAVVASMAALADMWHARYAPTAAHMER